MKKLILIISLFAIQLPASAQWMEQSSGFLSPGIGIIDIKVINDQVVWAAGTDMSGPGAVPVQLFTRTLNGGDSWDPGTVSGSAGMNISSLTAVNAQTAWVSLYTPIDSTGITSGKIMKTTDGGQTWTHQTTASFAQPQGFINKVHFFDTNNGVAMGNVNGGYFEIYTTTDGGANWLRVPQANIPAALSNEIGYINVFSHIGDKIWFGTTRARVFISENRGLNWTAHNTGLTRNDPTLPVITNLDFKNAMVGLAQNDSTLRKTIDGGITWTDMNFSGPVHHYDLRFVTGSQQTWISTGANYQANDIGSSISYNDGQTWVSLNDSTLHTVVDFVSENVGYSGGINASFNQGGIFKWMDPTSAPASVKAPALQVYPNPASGIVSVAGLEPGKKATIELTDVMGRLIFTENLIPGTKAAGISLPATATGLHYLRITQNGYVKNQKLVIQ